MNSSLLLVQTEKVIPSDTGKYAFRFCKSGFRIASMTNTAVIYFISSFLVD